MTLLQQIFLSSVEWTLWQEAEAWELGWLQTAVAAPPIHCRASLLLYLHLVQLAPPSGNSYKPSRKNLTAAQLTVAYFVKLIENFSVDRRYFRRYRMTKEVCCEGLTGSHSVR